MLVKCAPGAIWYWFFQERRNHREMCIKLNLSSQVVFRYTWRAPLWVFFHLPVSHSVQWSFCVYAQGMKDDVTLQRRLSLAGQMHKMINAACGVFCQKITARQQRCEDVIWFPTQIILQLSVLRLLWKNNSRIYKLYKIIWGAIQV